VNPSGTKQWRYKFRIEGKELTYGIGQFPDMGLAQARQEHELARQSVALGVSPVLVRKKKKQEMLAATANCFEAVARRWIAEKRPHWSDYYHRQVVTTLERDVFPFIGKHPMTQVNATHLRTIVKSVAERTQPPDGKRARGHGAATVAILIKQWCSAVFRYAVANGAADSDPTYAIRDLVTRPKVKHHRHLSAAEVPAFVQALEGFNGTSQVKIAIELLLLTFVRTGELRHAEWVDIDFESALWRIPGHKMKMGKEHIVPLSGRAVELLKDLLAKTLPGPFLFPNQRTPAAVMSMTTVNRALERLGYGGKLSGHGFRGTASTFLNESGFSPRLIEKQLAHDRRNAVEASYNHAQYLQERREMMVFWADFVQSKSSNVVPIKKLA
tara:strand:+ start:5185 stop:6336 length:1152 start_codon:yes stop_codon:yes gene_type:complete